MKGFENKDFGRLQVNFMEKDFENKGKCEHLILSRQYLFYKNVKNKNKEGIFEEMRSY